MKKIIASFATFALLFTTVLSTGCGTSAPVSFPQATFKTLVTSRAVLASLETSDPKIVTKYATQVNQAVDSFNAAEDSFVAFYSTGTQSQAQVTTDIALLSADVVTLVSDFTTPVAPVKSAEMKLKFAKAKASNPKISLVDLLPYFSIAIAVLQAVPATSPYASLAAVGLQAVTAGVAAYNASTVIDVTKLTHLSHVAAI